MEINTYYGRCACCLSCGYLKTMWEEHYWKGSKEIYVEMLVDCFGLAWEQSEDSIKRDKICEICIKKLRNANDFKNTVLYSQSQLQCVEQDDTLVEFDNCIDNLEDTKTMEFVEVEYLEDENNEEFVDFYNASKIKPASKTTTKSLKKSLRGNYTQGDLATCVSAFINGELKLKEASEKYNVPISTITAKSRSMAINKNNSTDISNRLTNVHKKRALDFKIKNNVRNILQYSNATLFKGYWSMGYACAYCSFKNSSPSALKSHTLQSHIGLLEDFNVTASFSDMMIKLDITGLECLICSEEFCLLDDIMIHLKSLHEIELHLDLQQKNIVPFKFDNKELTCALCEKPFDHFKYLTEHMTEHFRNYECDICGRGFIYEKNLKIHKPRHLIGDYKCSYCDKVFKNKLNMKSHERIKHMKCSRTRKCNFCSEMFMNTTQKSKHEVSVHGAEIPSYSCNACNKSFFSIIALKTHTKRFHLLLKPHKCDICDKGFYYKYGLYKHQVKHTGDRRYQCDICKKWYTSRSTLMGHMKIHMGDKRYKCDICEQAFVQKGGLLAHLKSKHNVKS